MFDFKESITNAFPDAIEGVDENAIREGDEILSTRYHYLEHLYRLSKSVTRATTVEQICEETVSELLEALDANHCAILLFDESRKMRFHISRGLSESCQAAFEGHSPWLPGNVDAEPILIPRVADEESMSPFLDSIQKEGVEAMAFIPIAGKNELLGKFMICMDHPYTFTTEEVQLCCTISGQVAFAIERVHSEIALTKSRNELKDYVDSLRNSEERLKHSLIEVQSLNDTLEERVKMRTKQVRALASVLTLAEQRERQRISQVLHDDLQQLLYGQLMSVDVIRKSLSATGDEQIAQRHAEPLLRAQQLLERLEQGIEQAIDATRTLAVELNPPILKSEGFVDALRWLGRHMESAYRIQISIEIHGEADYPAGDTRTLLIQMIRELLFNVVKHADNSHARVTIETRHAVLYVRVQDQGKGFDVEEVRKRQKDHGGYGLFSIEERLALVGGTLEIDSSPDSGTAVTIGLPLEAVEG